MPKVLGILDFSTTKNELFPVVAAVFSRTSSLAIKIRGLEAFGILCGAPAANRVDTSDGLDGADLSTKVTKSNNPAVLDKYTVQEKVVPLLKAIKTKEPAVMMAALPVFRQIGKMVDTDFLAMDVLPMVWSFSLGPLLNLQQFQDYMKLIKALSSRIEQEQTRKLSELPSNSNTNAGLSGATDLMGAGSTNGVHGPNGAGEVGLNDFERLVLGKSKDVPGASARPEPQRAQTTHSETPVFAWSTVAPTLGSHPTSRAITPDQALNSFAALSPRPRGQVAASNSTLNSFSTLTPMQPTLTPFPPNLTPLQSTLAPLQPTLTPSPPAWPLGSPTSSTSVSTNRVQSLSTFSVSPPQTATTSFSTFSIAPPPRHPVLSSGQSSYGKGLAAPGKSENATKQKSGLDAFESLL